MWEKLAAGGILFLLSTIMGFFWKNQAAQDERMKEHKQSISDAHSRITKQSEANNNKYARRDDVSAMEERIIRSVTDGLADLKDDIRAMSK